MECPLTFIPNLLGWPSICLGSERSTAGEHTFSKMPRSFGPLFVVQSLFHVQQSFLNFRNTNVTYLFQQRTDRLQTRDVKHRKEFELVEILSPFISRVLSSDLSSECCRCSLLYLHSSVTRPVTSLCRMNSFHFISSPLFK